MEGITITKDHGFGNGWYAKLDGRYIVHLDEIRRLVREGMPVADAVAQEWRSASTTNRHILSETISVLELWYEGGEILMEGEYQLVGDHLREVA
jgi:streptogramin lyase